MEYRDFLAINGDSTLSERGISPYSFESIDSTNTIAREMTRDGRVKAPALFLANRQTGGRGRLGRSFFSPADTGIYMTLVLDVTDGQAASVTGLTSAAAVAVARGIRETLGISVGIKWVNDLYHNGKKVCGILAESFLAGERRYAAVGIGINLSTDAFPEELAGIAGSLCNAADKRRELTLAVCRGVYDIYGELCRGELSYMNEYRRLSIVLGKEVTFIQNGVSYRGVAVSVSDDGALSIRTDDGGKTELRSGEITLRLKEVSDERN